MIDGWLELLRLCVMGAVGLGGAWLGAQATRRRERWSHRREVYQPILYPLWMSIFIRATDFVLKRRATRRILCKAGIIERLDPVNERPVRWRVYGCLPRKAIRTVPKAIALTRFCARRRYWAETDAGARVAWLDHCPGVAWAERATTADPRGTPRPACAAPAAHDGCGSSQRRHSAL